MISGNYQETCYWVELCVPVTPEFGRQRKENYISTPIREFSEFLRSSMAPDQTSMNLESEAEESEIKKKNPYNPSKTQHLQQRIRQY